MRIEFDSIHYLNKNNYMPLNRGNYFNNEVSHNEEKVIKAKLKGTFPSIIFWMRGMEPQSFSNNLHFSFDDPADEAFFLVWSSDGIEL